MRVSDRALTILFVVALFTVVGSVVLVLNALGYRVPFTGAATLDTGSTSLTVTGAAAISFVGGEDAVVFGSGTLYATGQVTGLNTTDKPPSTFAKARGLQVRNDGNVDVNISLNGSTAAQLMSGTSPTYKFNITAHAEAGCTDFNATGLTDMSNDPKLVCGNLTYPDATDELNISIYLEVPADEPAALHNDSIVVVWGVQI